MKRWPILLLAALIAGCSTRGPRVSHNPPLPPPPADLAAIPDAVPQRAPRSRYGNPTQYSVAGQTYRVMKEARGFRQRGIASWYGPGFHGKRTSSGEPYDMYAMTAAHKTLPLPSWVRVTNLDNGRQVVVKVNDRGPFHPGRIIDLSYTAAWKLGMLGRGTAPVEIEVITPDDPPPAVTRAAPAPAAGRLVQVGAFAEARNARSLKRRLERRLGIPVRIQASAGLHRVLAGPLDADQRRRLEAVLLEWGLSTPLAER